MKKKRCFDWGKSRLRSGRWVAPAGVSPDPTRRWDEARLLLFFFSSTSLLSLHLFLRGPSFLPLSIL
ncbi:hypothetical protein LZ32DRAFT_256121 [Colletotrichum eremochloae]|nr:hypothetical protein LZ32DRAFT_256121 [Colletotrichum eremochloae]